MTALVSSPRRQAAVAVLLLVGTGLALGIVLDRMWLGRAPAAAQALTLESMAEALDLDTLQQQLVSQRLDSLEQTLDAAVAAGPDSLRAAARRARSELEAVLPADRRLHFRRWMEQHRARMIEHMGGRRMGPRHEMMRPGPDSAEDTGDRGMMRRGRRPVP